MSCCALGFICIVPAWKNSARKLSISIYSDNARGINSWFAGPDKKQGHGLILDNYFPKHVKCYLTSFCWREGEFALFTGN